MKYSTICLILLFLSSTCMAQLDKYRVVFTDKDNSPYSELKPQEFLSPRAIERRKKQGIEIDNNDLPITPIYTKTLKDLGATIINQSKWLNSAIVTGNSQAIQAIKKLPFIKYVRPVGKTANLTNISRVKTQESENIKSYKKLDSYYGYASNQIQMLKGHLLHDMGYRGKGMLIGVLDGGFLNVDIMPFFDTLRTERRLWESKDFVQNDNYAYESGKHGTDVLSTMAANLPGLMVGTAPDADYVCIKTENIASELIAEEDNWVAGAEYADSLGVDVISASLGYTTFDQRSMNHTYIEMDGQTTSVSIGASIAASKGILLVNSAGNAGQQYWRFIGSPADALGIFAVGSVDREGYRSPFSSYGPSADGRIKPDVVARGEETIVASIYNYDVDYATGTSFAAPIIAGMMTTLWQAFPNKTSTEIKDAVRQSANYAHEPNNAMGYGIPDFMKAFELLSKKDVTASQTISYDALQNKITINPPNITPPSFIIIHNKYNEVLFKKEIKQIINNLAVRKIQIPTLASGLYRVSVFTDNRMFGQTIVNP